MKFFPKDKINRVFFTGAPGSRWSGIAQQLEASGEYDITDRSDCRCYYHNNYTGHLGVYFGTGMEFPASLDSSILDSPYTIGSGIRLHKSHEWAYMLDDIADAYPDDKIMMIYRDNDKCFEWWHQAGGWNITYPNYDFYINDENMKIHIDKMNTSMLKFADKNKLEWTQISETDIFQTVWSKK